MITLITTNIHALALEINKKAEENFWSKFGENFIALVSQAAV